MSKYSQLSRQSLVLSVFLYLLTLSPVSARQQMHGHIPQEVNSSSYIGPMDAGQTLNLAIGLPLQNQDGLQQFLNDVYDPHSPLYHHFLTPEQFAQQFGPSDSDYQTVVDFSKAHNLIVTNTYPNHLLVDVQGSVSDIQKTFHVNLKRYRRKDGSEFHAPNQEPSVDLDVPVTYIGGLQNYGVAKPALVPFQKVKSNIPAQPNQGTGPLSFGIYPYFGSDFRNAYFPSSGSCNLSSIQGAGQTVALVEFDSYYTSDITAYASDASFSSFSAAQQLTNIQVVNISSPGADNSEVALDIEMILCMAPAAHLNVYEEPNGGTADSMYAQIASGKANQISSSWSGPGTGDVNITNSINEFAAQGQSYFQAAGDDGSYVGSNVVPDPIDLTSEMTVVGGTELATSGTGGHIGNYQSETTWNQSGNAGGGGIVAAVPIPTYQIPFVNGTNGASAADRNIPDVSFTADAIEVYYNNGSKNVFSGTSASTPLWAGLAALINDEAALAAKGPMGFLNPFLYSLASNATTYANDFNDIKDGSNNNASGSGLYPAVSGYDLATGLGSPKCAMIADLFAPLATNTLTPTPTITNTPTITPTPSATPTITNTPTPPTTNTSYAYPQPAHNGQVFIVYNSPIAQQVRINIYSLSGQQVDSVMDSPQASNQNRILISLQGFVPSVYYYIINGLSSGVLAKGKFLVVP